MSNIVRMHPELPNSFIHEKEIAIPRLCSVLDAAVIEHELVGNNSEVIYASDGLDFPV